MRTVPEFILPEEADHCTHQGAGLCGSCLRDQAEDESAWAEYGRTPEGEDRWAALRAEMRDRPAEGESPGDLPL